jgi:hypothetical protein
MKVSELITKLQQLNHDHFCAMKELVPMGQVPPEPRIYVEEYNEYGEFVGFTDKLDVILDLQTGIQLVAL